MKYEDDINKLNYEREELDNLLEEQKIDLEKIRKDRKKTKSFFNKRKKKSSPNDIQQDINNSPKTTFSSEPKVEEKIMKSKNNEPINSNLNGEVESTRVMHTEEIESILNPSLNNITEEDKNDIPLENEPLNDIENINDLSSLDKLEEDKQIILDIEDDDRKIPLWLKLLIGIAIISAGSGMGVLAYNMLNQLSMPEISTWTAEDIDTWSKDNSINVNLGYDYSEEIESGNIISYSPAAETTIKKNGYVDVLISLGKDPHKAIDLIAFDSMKVDEIQEYMDENDIYTTEYVYETNEEVPKGQFINQEFVTGSTDEFTRSDKVIIHISKGKLEESTVIVEELVGKSIDEAKQWAGLNGINLDIDYSFDSTNEAGIVLNQNIASGTEVKYDSSIKITVSNGAGVKIPDFKNKSRSYIDSWKADNDIKVVYTTSYHNSVSKDLAYSQSINSGKTVASNSTIEIGLSMGQVPFKSFVNKDENELLSWVNSINKDGAKITVKETSKFNDDTPIGSIVSHDYSDKSTITIGSIIDYVISKGNGATVINLTDKTKEEIQTWATEENLTVSFTEEYNSKADGTAFWQSVSTGTEIAEGENLAIKLSLGSTVKTPIPNCIGQNSSCLTNWADGENAKGANIKISHNSTNDKYSDDVASGNILTVSKSGSISTGTTITYTKSLGKGATVIDFTGKTKAEIESWMTTNDMSGTYSYKYTNAQPADQAYGQSIASGKEIPDGTTIAISMSLGNLVSVPSCVGSSPDCLSTWKTEENNKGASVSYSQSGSEFNQDIAMGNIVSISPVGGSIALDGSLTYVLSKGPTLEIPAYTAYSDLESWVNSQKASGFLITLNKTENYDGSITSGNIIGSYGAGGTVNKYSGTTLSATVSLGPVPSANIPPYNMMSSSDPNQVKTDIENSLRNLGFTVNDDTVQVKASSNGSLAGTVFYQSHVGSTTVDTEVFVYVSNGQ